MNEQDRKTHFPREDFALDTCGITVEATDGLTAECRMQVLPKHKNALGVIMGGAIFTLADFAAGVAVNYHQPMTVTTTATIHFLTASRGSLLIARAYPVRRGNVTLSYRVEVHDDLGEHIATFLASCQRVQPK